MRSVYPTAILRSSTLRLTLAYLAIFTLSAGLLVLYLYNESTRFMGEQTAQTIEAELNGLREEFDRNGIAGLKAVIDRRVQVDRPGPEAIYLLETLDGRWIAGNINNWPRGTLEEGRLAFVADLGSPLGPPILVRAVGYEINVNLRARLLVGRSIEDRLDIEERHFQLILNGGIGMLVMAVAGGFILSRFTLSKLENINRAASQIIAGDFSRRVKVAGGGDEFDELAVHLNTMLQRIERLLAGMREVTDNIAHDLRTPLSRMRSRLELALIETDDNHPSKEVIEATITDAQGLIDTFNALLNIARADSGERQSEWEIVDLSVLAADVFDLFEPLAEERSIQLSLDAPNKVEMTGSRQLLAQAIANLVDNAIKFTPEHGKVQIKTSNQPTPLIQVTDNGPGIPADSRGTALERFVRLEASRTTPGNGLGLSLVKAVASLHDGSIDLSDAAPGLLVKLAFKRALKKA